jgi:outer membrane protein TolC
LLQAERLAEVAVASIDQLNAQLRQARSFHENGTVSQDDVLRAQLAVANAEQRRIAVQARVTLERVHLAMLLGLPPNTPIEAEPIANDHPLTADGASLEQDEKTAETQRLELREVDRRIELSDYDKRLAYAKLAPQINVVGAYVHNVGSLLAQRDSAYVGAVASWNLWDWGTTLSGISEAKVRQRQALIARMKIADQIRMEVTQAYLGVGTASEAMDVAKAAVAAAEENYRLVSKRRDAAVATSFDVVDAEALLTQARGQMQTALYDFVIARAALHAAMGATPDALAKE